MVDPTEEETKHIKDQMQSTGLEGHTLFLLFYLSLVHCDFYHLLYCWSFGFVSCCVYLPTILGAQ